MTVPQVNSISPNNGDVTGGEEVTVTGQNLTGATAVAFGAAAVTSFTVVDNQHITVVAPAVPGLVTGIVDVTVTTPAGTSAFAGGDHFTYTSPTHSDILNAITALDANASALAGITANVDEVLSDDATTSTALAALATGIASLLANDVAIATSVASLGSTVGQIASVVLPVQPTLTAVTPDLGSDSGGTAVVLTGTGFTHATRVEFATTPTSPGSSSSTIVPSFTVDSDTQITTVTPRSAYPAGTVVHVFITTGPLQLSNANNFPNPGPNFTYE